MVFGSTQPEGFDPLAFSKLSKDYPLGGTSSGERWSKAEVSLPERKDAADVGTWQATLVQQGVVVTEVADLSEAAAIEAALPAV